MTYGRIVKLFRELNSAEAIPVLNSKHLFNARFSRWVRRRWLYSKKMTAEDFAKLCNALFNFIYIFIFFIILYFSIRIGILS